MTTTFTLPTNPAIQLVQKVLLTPALAQEILIKNTANRPVKRDNQQMLELALRSGQWKFNGDAIRIADDGTVLDGQHRCLAVVATGISAETLLITGLPGEVFSTIDCGATRSKGDTLATMGEASAKNLAAALALINVIDMTGDVVRSGIKLSNQQIIELLERYPDARQAPDYKLNKFASAAVNRAMYYLFLRSDRQKAHEFFELLTSGIGLAANSPIYHLRQRLINNAASKNSKMTTRFMCALYIKAWNFHKAGRTCTVLRFVESGTGAEVFPIIG